MQSQKNDVDQSDERKRRQIMGTWLSLSPPRIHLCHICKECFPSAKALWGHQNAHRGHQSQQLNKMHHRMHLRILDDRELGEGNKQRQRKVLEGGRVDTSSSVITPSTKRARNNSTDAGNDEIDVELRLGSYPAPQMKVMKFYDFLGTVKEGKGYGGENGANGDGVGGESEPIAAADDADERVFCGGNDNSTGLDLPLKL